MGTKPDRWRWLLVVLLGVGLLLAAQIPRLEINAETDAFMAEDDPGLATYYETRGDWGFDEFAVVCVTADDWFTPEGVRRLSAIRADLEAVPHVSKVMSLFDVPLLRQHEDGKLALSLLRSAIERVFLDTAGADLVAAEAELREHELASGNFISADGRSVNLLPYLSFDEYEGEFDEAMVARRRAMVEGVRAVAAKWSAQLDEPVRLSGIPFVNITTFDNVRRDLTVFGAASLAIFALAFALVYRRLRFVLVPMLGCLLVPGGVLGAMVLLGKPIAIVTSNMPVLLFVLMLPYHVYFIERYRERRGRCPDEAGFASVLSALRSIWLPCAFSAATTVAGFVALGFSRIVPIADFGQLMAAGVAVGLLVTFAFIAAATRGGKPIASAALSTGSRASATGFVRALQNCALARPWLVVLGAAAVLALSALGALRLDANNNIASYFWPGSEVREGLEFVDSELGGTTSIEIILTSPEEDFFRSKAGLEALATAESYFATVPETGNILSLTSLRDELRKTLRGRAFLLLSDGMILGSIAKVEPEIIAQMSVDGFSKARTTVRMKETAPGLDRQQILDGLDRHLAENTAAFEGLEVQVTGVFPVYNVLLVTLLEGQKSSIVWVPVAVFLMLLFLLRSPVLALIVLLPQALPATVLLGVMGWAGIPLDLVTTMIASIAIGVGIDAAIQYTLRYRAELEGCGGDHREALRRAHATVGRAIWIATTIIVAGFSILVLSKFFPSVWFGLFTALAMLISQLATLTLLPSLFLLTGYPRAPKRAPN